ncbi:HU family DNA-binding protein [Streptomyces sp. NPDC087851]|uniref:HU family DNA-binding protein n=1 Tax=Streptomyces sp. NPDC087851 TaxID=3365810 RepID=UPI00380B15C4
MSIQILTAAVVRDTGVTHAVARTAVTSVFDAIARSLAVGETITISNFGTFAPVTLRERRSHNPATGAPLTAPETVVPRFRARGRLRDMVRDQDPTASVRKLPAGRYARR